MIPRSFIVFDIDQTLLDGNDEVVFNIKDIIELLDRLAICNPKGKSDCKIVSKINLKKCHINPDNGNF